MIECLILGDSIAVGVSKFTPTECKTYAHVGINSREFNHLYGTYDFAARAVVISLGSNDSKTLHTQAELRRLRGRVISGKVFWILPHNSEKIDMIIQSIAKEYGDYILPIHRTGSDDVHPTITEYRELAKEIFQQ